MAKQSTQDAGPKNGEVIPAAADERKQMIEAQTAIKNGLDARLPEITRALPAHMPPERFARVVMTAVQRDPMLLQADRMSLFQSAMQAAQDGLLPDGREGALVVYNTKTKIDGRDAWTKKVQWMPMIAGIRKKARNSGEIIDWEAHVVYERDDFEYELGDEAFIRHRPALGNRGEVIAAYSICKMKGGGTSREIMGREDINKIRAASKSKDGPAWSQWFDEMARKSVARRHAKSLPMSSDLDDLIRRDDALYSFDKKDEAPEQRDRRSLGMRGRLDALAGAPPMATALPAPEPMERVGEVVDHDPETGEIREEAQRGEPTREEPAREEASSAKAEQAKPANDDFPGDKPSKLDPLAVARQRGETAFKNGVMRRSVPGEYRDEPRAAEREEWLAGWDVAKASEPVKE